MLGQAVFIVLKTGALETTNRNLMKQLIQKETIVTWGECSFVTMIWFWGLRMGILSMYMPDCLNIYLSTANWRCRSAWQSAYVYYTLCTSLWLNGIWRPLCVAGAVSSCVSPSVPPMLLGVMVQNNGNGLKNNMTVRNGNKLSEKILFTEWNEVFLETFLFKRVLYISYMYISMHKYNISKNFSFHFIKTTFVAVFDSRAIQF